MSGLSVFVASFELWTPVGIWVQKAVHRPKPAGQEENLTFYNKKICSDYRKKPISLIQFIFDSTKSQETAAVGHSGEDNSM